jgi:hypothetical protein
MTDLIQAQQLARTYDAESAGLAKLARVAAYLQADAFQLARSWAHGNDAAGPELLASHAACVLVGKVQQDWIESI